MFDRTSTADDVLAGLDLTGRRFVITGASGGLGEESARSLAAHGAAVVLLGRSVPKLEAAVDRIDSAVPHAELSIGDVDLASLASIRAFAERFVVEHPAVDVLINNAGVMACPFGRTADGFEMQFGTNHLGHFLLTGLVLPSLLAGDRPRIVNVSSAAHVLADVDLDDPNFEHTEYDPWIAYGRSKTANVLFTRELTRRLSDRGVLSFALHPGSIPTELERHTRSDDDADDDGPHPPERKTIPQGAATQVWAATAVELADHNGAYLGDCRLGSEGGDPGTGGYQPYAMDADNARRLWLLSERLVAQPFD